MCNNALEEEGEEEDDKSPKDLANGKLFRKARAETGAGSLEMRLLRTILGNVGLDDGDLFTHRGKDNVVCHERKLVPESIAQTESSHF